MSGKVICARAGMVRTICNGCGVGGSHGGMRSARIDSSLWLIAPCLRLNRHLLRSLLVTNSRHGGAAHGRRWMTKFGLSAKKRRDANRKVIQRLFGRRFFMMMHVAGHCQPFGVDGIPAWCRAAPRTASFCTAASNWSRSNLSDLAREMSTISVRYRFGRFGVGSPSIVFSTR